MLVMIIDRIKRHNAINGFLFSFIEFALIAVLIGGFAIYAFIRDRLLIGAAGLGIAMNAFPVMWFSIQSLRAKEKQIGISGWFSGEGRASIAKRYPETSVDTTVIVSTTVIPFLALLLTFIDAARHTGRKL